MIANTFSIDEVIKNKNPFAGHTVVRSSQIWGKSFPDVPSINAHASNAVFDAVDKVIRRERETVGITITAERGAGKSHIISRIRHGLQTKDNALFIYMGKYENLNNIKYEFLQTVASSLRAHGCQKVMQWQEIATALINEAMDYNYTPQKYIDYIYPEWLKKFSNKFIDKLTEIILKNKPEITNPYLVRAILWTLSSVHNTYANYWLSGLELTPQQTEVMGLPNIEKTDKQAEGLKTVRQILDIISDYKVPVICFDELDIAEADDNGFLSAQVIASLAKDLYNNLKRGVLLLGMYPGTWNEQIRVLPQSEAVIDRLVSEQSDRKPLRLNHLNSDDIVAIVNQWLGVFYLENQVTPPHPLYPFNENELRKFGKSKPTVRSILKWCAENFNLSTIINPVEEYYQNELTNVEASINELMEDEDKISQALRFAFSTLVGEELEGINIEAIQDIQAKAADKGYIDFKIVGNNSKVKIGVDVLQQSTGKYVGAALKRLIKYKEFDITRGCLVRSKKISHGAKVPRECLEKLLHHQGGEWVMLQSQDIKPLLAIWFVYSCKNYELSKEQIFDFIKQEQIAINNPLIREILSDPSGQEPTNLTDDDLPISIPQSVDISAQNDIDTYLNQFVVNKI